MVQYGRQHLIDEYEMFPYFSVVCGAERTNQSGGHRVLKGGASVSLLQTRTFAGKLLLSEVTHLFKTLQVQCFIHVL